MTAVNVRDQNQRMSTAAQIHQVDRTQHDVSGPVVPCAQTVYTPKPMVSRPQVDATDRRDIEAQNEAKAHTTKDELDDIKRTHYKEKQKKEQNNIELCQTGVIGESRVIQPLIW